MALAQTLGLSRNTVHARVARFTERDVVRSFERRIDPSALGYPLTAFITVTVTQRMLDEVGERLERIPEVIEVIGLSGAVDLLVRVAAIDGDDMYRVAGQILAQPGVERTETFLAMRRLVDYRVAPLLQRALRSQP
jgi:DNA-binding Lrp family transcriptional regulator